MKKISQYNIVVKSEDKNIYFNTLTGVKIGLSNKEHSIIENEFKNLESFAEKFPNVFNNFYKSGFIIDNNRNEKEEVLFNKKKAIYLDREYELFLHPTLDCNFNCWYCYEEHPKGMMRKDVFDKIQKHIKLMSKNITGLHLSWFGGEPMMYFNEIIYPMSLYAKDIMSKNGLSFKNSITTNAYYINNNNINLFKEIDLNNFQITIDGDKERHDKIRQHYGEPTFELIINNVINICESIKDAFVILRINYDKQTLKTDPSFLNIIPKEIRNRIKIDLQKVWQVEKKDTEDSFNDDIIRWKDYLWQQGFNISYSYLSPNNNYGCYANRYYNASIDHLGRVYKCTACGYAEKDTVGELLASGEIQLKKEFEAKWFHKLPIENEDCEKCVFLPMCSGYCNKKYYEYKSKNNGNVCLLNGENLKEQIIKEYQIFKQSSNLIK